MSAVLLPPAGTTTGVASAEVRYWVEWHRAQLKPTRGTITVFFENPDGNSFPSSHGSPSDA